MQESPNPASLVVVIDVKVDAVPWRSVAEPAVAPLGSEHTLVLGQGDVVLPAQARLPLPTLPTLGVAFLSSRVCLGSQLLGRRTAGVFRRVGEVAVCASARPAGRSSAGLVEGCEGLDALAADAPTEPLLV